METSRLWREVVTRVHEVDYRDVKLEHALVDSTAMQLIRQPRAFDVILTENMFGDILSDEASVLGGSIGLAPSASLGAGGPGLFEPVHGSAPDIAGRDLANPVGAILSVALMLRYGLHLEEESCAVEEAVEYALTRGARTTDLGGSMGCQEMAETIADEILRAAPRAHYAQMHWG
jgi:3-isopropylmalate dehydrogenase